MTTLVIVESPGKVKKIGSFLGAGYRVVASVGHVRDLPKNKMGLEPPDFAPLYEPTERGREVLERLEKEVSRASHVVLATDPDREGEAIAWHLADSLSLSNPDRVTFTAITEEAVKKALANPRAIDMGRVRSQEARRSLDRIVGYRVSRALSDRLGEPLTAGRVQSPAVRIVVDRENAITAFKPTKHFGVELSFDNAGSVWKAQWDTKPHLAENERYVLDPELARRVASVRDVTVSNFEEGEKRKGPAAPFTTSTLQQAASQRLKFRPARTMELAQKLYEQGAITYHRTDAPNMDDAGIADIADYARSSGLELADKPRRWKAKESAQEGHEAIRPAHANELDRGETDDEKALYQLIWQRAIASQLADARYAVRSARLEGKAGELKVSFLATGRTLTFPGWQTVYAENSDDDEEGDTSSNPIPELLSGSAITAASGVVLNKSTQAPPRFTEATLVKEMERLGIGRPSTYAAIMENITSRGYVIEGAKRFLQPAPTGGKIRDALVGRFTFVDLDYTRNLEAELDLIAEGSAEYKTVVAGAWNALDSEIASLDQAGLKPAYPCPNCGKAMVRRKGTNGFFWACTGYPDCKTSLPDNKGKPGVRKPPPPPTGFKCVKCGSELARRKGIGKKARGKTPKPYDFYSCTGFPKCDATYQTGPDGKPVFEQSE